MSAIITLEEIEIKLAIIVDLLLQQNILPLWLVYRLLIEILCDIIVAILIAL